VAAYAFVSVLWIAFSDHALGRLVTDPIQREHAQTIKGAIFILVTSFLLYALIRRSERGLRAVTGEVRATLDSIADGVLLVDANFLIVEVNRAAVALVGASSKQELIGPLEEWGRKFALRYVDGTPVPFDRYASMRALDGERVLTYDAMLRRADGRDVFVNLSAAPVDDPRTTRLAVAVIRDVTSARRLDEIREEFLATAAHEFKTPLAVIKAYAQVVQKRRPEEGPALTVVQRQVDRLNRLVQHLLDTSRLRLDSGEGRRDRFDLGLLATEVVERARSSASEHALLVEASGPAPVRADRDRIARVINGLVDNAIRFSPGGGAVETRVDRDGAVAILSVKDHGLGIPAERQARLFERYYRAHAGTAQDYGGLGLGLDMSREIVTRHGGRMWFESTPGEGSIFHFSLPLAPEEP
jgi:two-component system phosphate regulon sensor histidine kinase PhoR